MGPSRLSLHVCPSSSSTINSIGLRTNKATRHVQNMVIKYFSFVLYISTGHSSLDPIGNFGPQAPYSFRINSIKCKTRHWYRLDPRILHIAVRRATTTATCSKQEASSEHRVVELLFSVRALSYPGSKPFYIQSHSKINASFQIVTQSSIDLLMHQRLLISETTTDLKISSCTQ